MKDKERTKKMTNLVKKRMKEMRWTVLFLCLRIPRLKKKHSTLVMHEHTTTTHAGPTQCVRNTRPMHIQRMPNALTTYTLHAPHTCAKSRARQLRVWAVSDLEKKKKVTGLAKLNHDPTSQVSPRGAKNIERLRG